MANSVSYPFDTSGNYTFDVAKVEVSGGEARLTDQYAAHQTANPNVVLAANFQAGGDAVYSDGTGTVTNNGGPTYTSGKVNLDISGSQYLHWDGDNIASSTAQTGAVRFLITPNYSGSPTGNVRYFLEFGTLNSNVNRVRVSHQLSGQINIRFYDQSASTMLSANLGVWGQTSGQEYEFELNWDFNTGATRLFIDGVQHGTTQTATGTRSTAVADIHLGDGIYGTGGNCGAKFNELLFFDTPQHTANYTPVGTVLPDTVYATDDPTIITNSAISASEIVSFNESVSVTGSDDIKYIMNIAGQDYWWNGSLQTSDGTYSQSNTATEINTNALEFLSVRSNVKVKAIIHSDDGSTTPELDTLTVDYNTAIADPNLNNLNELAGFIYDHRGAPVVGATVKARPYLTGQVTGDVFNYYKYHTIATTDSEGFFVGTIMALDAGQETELKIGSQSYHTVIPDQVLTDIKDLTLTAVEED